MYLLKHFQLLLLVSCCQDVDLDGDVLVSNDKAKFMTQHLSSCVGNEWFWMDILGVNQRDKAARIAVTQHIPTIFSRAERTIVIGDGGGLRDCCVRNLDTWFDSDSQDWTLLFNHYNSQHDGEVLIE